MSAETGLLVEKPPGGAPNRTPEWFPVWAARLSDLYFSGTTSMFILHGAVQDYVRNGKDPAYGTLADFLAEQIFGRWDLVLHFDLARGLRAFAGKDGARLKDMVTLANRKVGDLAAGRKDPATALAMLDRFVQNNIMAGDGERLAAAILIDYASFLVPSGEPGRLSLPAATYLVTLLNWAGSLHVKRLNMAFALMDEKVSTVSERLSSSPHVASIEVGMPDEEERRRFLEFAVAGRDLSRVSDFTTREIARTTAGMTLVDLNVVVQSALEGSKRLDAPLMRNLKKQLIERQCQGLLEFIQPKYTLDAVVGHEAAKQRLREDAELVKRGESDTLPMGYLVCGPVGTGKTFLAQCMAGEIGIPCVTLRNFRSKYVGETEGNLERVLSVLRAMGPVIVVVDEADAALGNRSQEGDSGTSSRVFSMIAAQMGDTRYRGQILWMLLTSRPDLLPIDLKRQGRAEVHIPLFYPADQDELKRMFVAMAGKLGAKLALEDVPDMPHRGMLSGADIEGIVGRALRRSLIGGASQVTREALAEAAEDFLPSTETAEKELQEVAAMMECTDKQFLPPEIRERIDALGGRKKLEERYALLRRMIELR
ncbi:MAG: ATP-binding protein [Bryobacteraceae bacterium]|nr:ATP-binding protein [Bryobacteraceae bacterium]